MSKANLPRRTQLAQMLASADDKFAELIQRVQLSQLPIVSDIEFSRMLGAPYSTWCAMQKHLDLPVIWCGRRKLRPLQATLAALERYTETEKARAG